MKIRSILDDISSIDIPDSTAIVAQEHGESIVNSARNLVEFLQENFPPDQAAVLEKKLVLAVRSGDPGKFTRAIKRAQDDWEF